jgi:hypothetical protein
VDGELDLPARRRRAFRDELGLNSASLRNRGEEQQGEHHQNSGQHRAAG